MTGCKKNSLFADEDILVRPFQQDRRPNNVCFDLYKSFFYQPCFAH